MAAQILSFAAARAREPASRDWSRQELAEFYRVEGALGQAGLALEGERGVSDEGDPWFVFCRADTGEVFIHFARVDGWYVVDGAAFGAPARGRDFGALVRDLIASHPLATVRRPGSNILVHPAALLIALVGAAFFHSAKAKAAEVGAHDAAADTLRAPERRGPVFNAGGAAPAADVGGARAVALDAAEVAAVLTGVAIGLQTLAASGDAAAAAPTAVRQDGVAPPQREALQAASRIAASESALAALPAADARAALTVMAVFHDLARATAATAMAAPATEAAAAPGVAAVKVDTTAAPPSDPTAPPPSAEAVSSQLVVRLASGPLPQIAAVALVTADGALTYLRSDHVVHVDALPSLFAGLIKSGEIVTIPAAPAIEHGGGGGGGYANVDPLPIAGADTHLSTGAGADMSSAGGVDAHAARGAASPADTAPAAFPADTPPVGSAPAQGAPLQAAPPQTGGTDVPAAPPAPAPAAPHPAAPAHDPRIDAAVLSFLAQVPDAKVMITGHEVVFYDPAILGVLGPGETLDSVTWRMEDGSSVSLVGTVSELHLYHGLG